MLSRTLMACCALALVGACNTAPQVPSHRVADREVSNVRCVDLRREAAEATPGCEEFMTLRLDTGVAAVDLPVDGQSTARATGVVSCESIQPDRVASYPQCLVLVYVRDGLAGSDVVAASAPDPAPEPDRETSYDGDDTSNSVSSGPSGDRATTTADGSSAGAELSRSTDDAGNTTESLSGSAQTANTSASVGPDSVSATAGSRTVSIER